MKENNRESLSADALLAEFFAQDDLRQLAADAGTLLECPLLVLDDAFHVAAHHCPLGFTDRLFHDAVANGEITYEAGAIISESPSLRAGEADIIKLDGSAFRRRFAPLISAGVRLGYLICLDTDGHLQSIADDVWKKVELILAKQLFIETSRQGKPFETAEDILMHLLDGGFPSAAYFRLQTANTYLADFHPAAFALIDLTAYHRQYQGQRRLKEEINSLFAEAHPFLYRGDIFLFLHGKPNPDAFSEIAAEFGLKIALSEPIDDLFSLPERYRTAREALELMQDSRFHGGSLCSVAQMRIPLLLKNLEDRSDLIPPALRALDEHDKAKSTQYRETLYQYLIHSRSLKKTCDALFTHRNTVLYRIRRIQEDFGIPLDDPETHTELLLGTALLLFQSGGPDFFMQKALPR